ncbi:MAG: class I SAM-dependent methyltransferase, partial [Proteobacteria bacterium]|nr:class I SAM-dependent methyltransferase [Pseudomonadota bacterium]
MSSHKLKKTLTGWLASAGIHIGGDKPWDIQVHNEHFYTRVLAQGSLGLGESYMAGWWDCPHLDQFFERVLCAHLDEKVTGLRGMWSVLKSKLINLQKPSRAYEIGQKHYDIGNDLFERMLDKRMMYSCGYWSQADNL